MKRFLLLASALLILGGCSIDNIEIDNKKDTPRGEQLRITANYASENEEGPANAVSTNENGPWRVAYDDPFNPSIHQNPEDHPPIDVVWAQNDKIVVHDYTQQGVYTEFTLQSGHGSRLAEFTGTNPEKSEGNQLKAIYPAKQYNSHWDFIEMSVIGQIQNGNKNMDHIAQYDYMTGDVILTEGNGGVKSATISFKRQIAIMKFVLDLPADIGTPEQLIISTANESFVTSQTLGTNNIKKATNLTLGLSNVTIAPGEPLVAYIAALPFSLTAGDFNLKVVGSQKQYQATIPIFSTKTYEAGKQYIGYMGVGNFTDVTPSAPVALNNPTGAINGTWAQIGGLKVTREGLDVPGVSKTKTEMSRGSADMTGSAPVELIGGDVVQLLANNNGGGTESGGYGGFWIDWNRDGVMDNNTEAIIFPRSLAGSIAAGAENVLMYTTGTYVIPDNKPDGIYYGRLMRGHTGLTDYVTAGENCTYIDFAIDYRYINTVPPGDPVANFVTHSDAAVNILEDDVTRTFTVKLNKRVENTPVEITIEATTNNSGHSGTLGSATVTIPVGSREGTGTITFAKTDFATPGTDDAVVTVTMTSIVGGVLGTDRVSIDYNVTVLDMSNMIEYTFNDDYYGGEGDDIAEITSGGYYGLVFRATNGTIPDGTVVNLSFSGNDSHILWYNTSSSGFPKTLTISESDRIFIVSVGSNSNSNGTLTITSESMPTTPAAGITINIP